MDTYTARDSHIFGHILADFIFFSYRYQFNETIMLKLGNNT